MRQTAKTMLQNRNAKVCAALLAADCLVFSMINPRDASAVWLITGYILFGLTFFALAGLLAASLKSYGQRTHAVGRRTARYSAAIVVALVGLQSIGQLTVRDVLTLLPLVIGCYLYIGYGKKTAMENASP